MAGKSSAKKRLTTVSTVSCVHGREGCDITDLMHQKRLRKGADQLFGRTIHTCDRSYLWLSFIVISVPLTFIYIGYVIGTLFMPVSPYIPSPGIVMDMAHLNYSWYNTHNLTVKFAGGLGNQMFQYAALYGISKANGFKPIICGHMTIGHIFHMLKANHVAEVCITSIVKTYGVYSERKSNAFDKNALSLNFMRNIALDGFFQSWRYFDHVRSDIRKQFQFHASTIIAVDSFIHDSSKMSNGTSLATYVGVHIRRGDMQEQNNRKIGYTVADASYLSRAVRYFETKYEHVIFIVCSDDMAWSTANIRSGQITSTVVFSHFSSLSPEYDLALLMRCNHSIITVGTFGWWGAWLSGGETVYYHNSPRQDSLLWYNFRFSDYYLPNWRAM